MHLLVLFVLAMALTWVVTLITPATATGVAVALLIGWGLGRVLHRALRGACAALKPVPKAPLSPTAQRILDAIFPGK
jgi:hypothetical protein